MVHSVASDIRRHTSERHGSQFDFANVTDGEDRRESERVLQDEGEHQGRRVLDEDLGFASPVGLDLPVEDRLLPLGINVFSGLCRIF